MGFISSRSSRDVELPAAELNSSALGVPSVSASQDIELGSIRPEHEIREQKDSQPEIVVERPHISLVDQRAFCGIWQESQQPAAMLAISGCGHAFCRTCIQNYAEGLVAANTYPIRCEWLA